MSARLWLHRHMLSALLLSLLSVFEFAQTVQAAPIQIQISKHVVREVDPRYLSLALDTSVVLGGAWWTQRQSLDLQNAKLRRLTRALAPAYLRIGGSDADRVFYHFPGASNEPPRGDSLVLEPERWQQITDFARSVGMPLLFTLNAGPGPRNAEGRWQAENARTLLRYAAQHRDPVAVWELGNEINGYPLLHGLWLTGQDYARDVLSARKLVDEEFPQAKLAGPASAFWPYWGEPRPVMAEALRYGGRDLDLITWHYYPQQSRRCPLQTRPASEEGLLSASALDTASELAQQVNWLQSQDAIQALVWLGETGHAQCGGAPGLSGHYVSALWWLDQLGLLAQYGQQVQIRQSLVGSDYGLLRESDLRPTPDYWASWLWKNLMGPKVLHVSLREEREDQGPPTQIRAYAHCAPTVGRWSLLLINLAAKAQEMALPQPGPVAAFWLTAPDLRSETLLLNGKPLQDDGHWPDLEGQAFASGVQKLTLPGRAALFLRFRAASGKVCS